MENDESKKNSWWLTLPGILSAITGFITALTGLLALLNSMGWLSFEKQGQLTFDEWYIQQQKENSENES